jgi:hypothetical protein
MAATRRGESLASPLAASGQTQKGYIRLAGAVQGAQGSVQVRYLHDRRTAAARPEEQRTGHHKQRRRWPMLSKGRKRRQPLIIRIASEFCGETDVEFSEATFSVILYNLSSDSSHALKLTHLSLLLSLNSQRKID